MASVTRAISFALSVGVLLPVAACGNGLVKSADLQGAAALSAARPSLWGESLSGAYLAGRHAERRFDIDQAGAFLAKALALDPDNLQLRQRVFLLSVSEGRLGDALPLAEALAESRDATPIATLSVAVEKARAGDLREAAELLDSLDGRRYYAFAKYAGGAWLKLARGEADAAFETLEPLANQPGFAKLHLLHKGLLADTAGRAEVAKEAYEALLQEDPRPSLRIVQIVGEFLDRQGEEARADAMYTAFRQDNPQSAALLPERTRFDRPVGNAGEGFAEAVFNLAGALYEDRDAGLALVHARLAQRLDADNPMIALLAGEILESQGRHAEARREYARIPADSPFAKAAALRVARGLDEQKRTDEAVAELRRLSEGAGGDTEALIALGHILRGHDRFAEAIAAYDAAVASLGELHPHHWSVLYARGIALERSGDWTRAEGDLKQALSLNPDQPYVLNYLGYSWVDRGLNYDEAEKLIARAVEMRPNDGFIADSLGWVYYVTGRYQEAVRELERAVGLEPGDPTINEHLGDAYWRVGRRNEARFQWSHALKLGAAAERLPDLEGKFACGLGGCPVKAAGGS